MRLAMVAGEASGDLLAAALIEGLKPRWPALTAAGIGGPRMRQTGFEAWWPSDKLAVNGFADALKHVRELSAIRSAFGDRVLAERPAAFIGVDAPDFNLGLEKRLKAAGLKTVHYVCPSIWAWRGGRAKTMARSCDHVLCLFPFEPELLHRHGMAATYVGHPLADSIPLEVPRAAARAALGLAEGDTVVAVLPGSRRGEIVHIAPVFLETAARLHALRPALKFVLPVAPGLRALLDPLVAAHAPGVPLQLLDGPGPGSHEALAACDLTLIASGTATLEAALFKRPMVIGYRVAWLSYQIMRHMGYLPWVGLPNILAHDFVVPEFLQHRCEPVALARAVLEGLDRDPAPLVARFTEMHHLLRRDTARRAADAIAQVVEG